ncbi:MAG: hypothetical protein OEZ45_06540 [Candidatus Aminicenantes bacterium]|nr:hypothetical protein [Candidatus Aminicenantes bacterium]
MKKAVIFFVIILLTLFLLGELKATPLQKSIIPAETNWVIHFDVEKFTSTRFGDQLLNNENILGLRGKNAEFYDKYKIDILKDINGVTIYGFGKGEKNIVTCLRGNFDREYLLGLLAVEESHREIQHGNFTIHKWDYHEFGAFADDHLALLAQDETAIKTALDVIAGKKANITASSLMPYLNEIPSNAFFAALAKDISEMVGFDTKVFVFKKTESALYTLTEEKENIHMKLNITVKTLEDAKNMESVIRGLISLATMQMEEADITVRLPQEEIKIATEGKKIRVEMFYPVKELVEILLGRVKFSPFHILTGFDLHP